MDTTQQQDGSVHQGVSDAAGPSAASEGAGAQWVAVVDRLPPEDIEVLLYWDKNFPMDVGLWNGRTWQRAYYDMGDYDQDPAFWSALPVAPEAA